MFDPAWLEITGFVIEPRCRLEDYRHLGAHALLAGEFDLGFVLHDDVLYDRKPESGTARRLGTALVDTVEPLKDTVLLLLRDADAGVAHCERRSLVLLARNDGHTAALLIIAHGIAAQIVEQFLDKRLVAVDRDRPAFLQQCDFVLLRRNLHLIQVVASA